MASASTTKQKDAEAKNGNGKAEEEVEEPTEKSWSDKVIDAMKEEGTRVFDIDTGKVVDDIVAYLQEHVTDPGVKQAKSVKKAYGQLTRETAKAAAYMAFARRSIILPTGNPDWSGVSKTYKEAVSPIIEAAVGEGESRVTAQNRLQKSATRQLSKFVVEYVLEENELDLTQDEAMQLVAQGTEVKTDDENVKQFVDLVNEQYRVGSHASNEPSSPFEEKAGRAARETPSTDEQKAIEAKKALPQFRGQILNALTLDLTSHELLLIVVALHEKLHTKEQPHFGEGGRKAVQTNLHSAAAILYADAKELDDQKPSKTEREAREQALASVK